MAPICSSVGVPGKCIQDDLRADDVLIAGAEDAREQRTPAWQGVAAALDPVERDRGSRTATPPIDTCHRRAIDLIPVRQGFRGRPIASVARGEKLRRALGAPDVA